MSLSEQENFTGSFTTYSQTPFEEIGFALSGGGFRAAAYGLGVLSVLNKIVFEEEDGSTSRLIEKVKFVSSASGGTITLIMYAAYLHAGKSFESFYKDLNHKLKGEKLLEQVIAILKNDVAWTGTTKSRNLINSFAKAYHDVLLSELTEKEKVFGNLMQNEFLPHIEEVCFNASDFYTGVSFRFQTGSHPSGKGDGQFGNANIGVNRDNKEQSIATLSQIRLGDILAASSCFPLGFEPIIYPSDFSYLHGPTTESLKQALKIDMYSWDTKQSDAQNQKSRRAPSEKAFVDEGVFGLMDGGICDNQGLLSLLLANSRKESGEDSDKQRFDLLMVSDVTSFFMKPYGVPKLLADKKFLNNSLQKVWKKLQHLYFGITKKLKLLVIALVVLAILAFLLLILQGPNVATVWLALTYLLPVVGTIWFYTFRNKHSAQIAKIEEAAMQPSPSALLSFAFGKNLDFSRKMVIKITEYLQDVPLSVIAQMLTARAQSASTMIGEVFLKHVRRLIYGSMYKNEKLVYRRLFNPIYDLSFTNNKNRRNPRFEDFDDGTSEYDNRRATFKKEFQEKSSFTEEMQRVAELAYNTGTTLWFLPEEESIESKTNNRQALIATGQFTTCYNLLGYALALRHSVHFEKLRPAYQSRITKIVEQLSSMMEEFRKDPFNYCTQN